MKHEPTNHPHIHRQHDDWDEVHNQMLEVQQKGLIQKKSLAVSEPGDADEKEADEVARKVAGGESATIHGTGGTINRKGEGGAEVTPEFQSKLESSKGDGQSLPENVQQEMGSKMGADFSDVKVHTGSEANAMNENVNAKAFAHGSDIYFGNGNYDLQSSAGKELLAHELVHTVQQGGGVKPKIHRKGNIDQPASVKIIQSRVSDGLDRTGVWDKPTQDGLALESVDYTDHEQILKWLFKDVVGESKIEVQDRIKKIESTKDTLLEIQKILAEAQALDLLIQSLVPSGTYDDHGVQREQKGSYAYFAEEKVKRFIPMILEFRSSDAMKKLEKHDAKAEKTLEDGNFGQSTSNALKSEQLDDELMQELVKDKNLAQQELTTFSYSQDDVKTVDAAMGDQKNPITVKTPGMSLESLLRKGYLKFREVDEVLTGGKGTLPAGSQTQSIGGTNISITATSANYFDGITKIKQVIVQQITGNYTTKNKLQVAGLYLERVRMLLMDFLWADLKRYTDRQLEPDNNADILAAIDLQRQGLKDDLPNYFQILINVGLDYLDISRSGKGILSIHCGGTQG